MNREDLYNSVLFNINYKDNILLEWCTGLGKSKMFILIHEYLKPKTVYICVAETNHIENWRQEYIKWGKEHLLEHTKIFCYNSLHNYINTEVDLLCNDECHHISELRLSHLQTIKVKKVVNLSATVNEDEKIRLIRLWGKYYSSMVNLNGAIENDLLPTPIINVVKLTLDNTIKDKVITFKRGLTSKAISNECSYDNKNLYIFNKSRYPNLSLKIKCTEQEYYAYLDGKVTYLSNTYKANRSQRNLLAMQAMGLSRKKFLAELKLKYLINLVNQVKESKRRFICFTGSTKAADALSTDKTIHSKIKDRVNILQRFNDKEINELYVVEMLKEGTNLNDIEIGIIAQLDSESRSFIQRLGRILRAETPELYVLYFENTIDESFKDTAIASLNKDYINEICFR